MCALSLLRLEPRLNRDCFVLAFGGRTAILINRVPLFSQRLTVPR